MSSTDMYLGIENLKLTKTMIVGHSLVIKASKVQILFCCVKLEVTV